MEVIILHQTIADGDAIGNDISEMYRVLVSKGYDVFTYCEYQYSSVNMQYLSKEELYKKIKKTQNLVIYHHSIYWEAGEEILDRTSANVIIRYHNITPSFFFKNYSKRYYESTEMGRDQTIRLTKKNYYWLCDSNYNNGEILKYGVKSSQTFVFPPFHKIEEMDKIDPDYVVLDQLLSNPVINVLFVGRVAPNKGHLNICHVANCYKKLFGNDFRIWVVGGFDNELSQYNTEINHLITKFNLQEHIIFTEKITNATLKSYFLGSDIFLCLSEHEGFGVPLIESQYFNIPVIALDTSAVKETLGDDQLILSEFNEQLLSSAINHIATNSLDKEFLINKGRENYNNRFSPEKLQLKFLDFIKDFEESRK